MKILLLDLVLSRCLLRALQETSTISNQQPFGVNADCSSRRMLQVTRLPKCESLVRRFVQPLTLIRMEALYIVVPWSTETTMMLTSLLTPFRLPAPNQQWNREWKRQNRWVK